MNCIIYAMLDAKIVGLCINGFALRRLSLPIPTIISIHIRHVQCQPLFRTSSLIFCTQNSHLHICCSMQPVAFIMQDNPYRSTEKNSIGYAWIMCGRISSQGLQKNANRLWTNSSDFVMNLWRWKKTRFPLLKWHSMIEYPVLGRYRVQFGWPTGMQGTKEIKSQYHCTENALPVARTTHLTCKWCQERASQWNHTLCVPHHQQTTSQIIKPTQKTNTKHTNTATRKSI